MSTAGVVLTGGTSRRMGADKAGLLHPASGLTLARRCAALLSEVTSPALELGPGSSGLPALPDDGRGPLAALAGAVPLWEDLEPDGHVVVLAVDLPRLGAPLLRWLVGHPAPGAVLPVVGGRLQPLCARYLVSDVRAAAAVVATGEERLGAWVAGLALHRAEEVEWQGPAGDPRAACDADTPEQMVALWSAEVGCPK